MAKKTKIGDGDPVKMDFRDGLYGACCADCGEELDWKACFDADGTDYHAECCGYEYTMAPDTVLVWREEPEAEDEEG